MKALIQNPGIEIAVDINNHILKFKVNEQSDEITHILRTPILDEETGLSLKSHNKPNWASSKRRFYVRGEHQERNNREVTIAFDNAQEATDALLAIQRILDRVSSKAKYS